MTPDQDSRRAFVPSDLYSVTGQVSFEQVISHDRKNRLSNKPRKQQAVSELHQLVTDGSRYLLNAGVPQKDIESWLFEPWEYNSITHARGWWTSEMMPPIRALVMVLNTRTHPAWKSLQTMNPKHGDFRQIKLKQQAIKQRWFKRPRYKSERGMVQERGY